MAKPQCSILMSIYNESEGYIRESITSILNQTFSDFELIIIIDNPLRSDVAQIISEYNDDRIKIDFNEKNIGLALSMNRAFNLASTDIIVRMDADDVAVLSRLEEQVPLIMSGKYDFVFSDYSFIDSNSNAIARSSGILIDKDEDLNKKIQLACMIHHPTVAFTRDIFQKAGGYRNFPCAQDLDLWLRMAEKGCRFGYLDHKLLRYRVNEKSTSSQKWHKQHLITQYIYELSLERLKKGTDSYSEKDFETYLKRWGDGDEKKLKKLRDNYDRLDKALCYRLSGHPYKSFIMRLLVFISSDVYRRHYLVMRDKKKYL